jgi:hypothetical protein
MLSLSYAKMQNIALSIAGALIASSLFISAAIGPAPII